MQERWYYTYMMASRTHVLYVGVSGDLDCRVAQHREGSTEGFTSRYRCTRLVWWERHANPSVALAREKQIKSWSRKKKIALIERENPTWADLSEEWGKRFV